MSARVRKIQMPAQAEIRNAMLPTTMRAPVPLDESGQLQPVPAVLGAFN
jgi:hypothetical protein